jgi:uncharacterized protein
VLERSVRWRSRVHGGLEDLKLIAGNDGTSWARSAIVGRANDRPIGVFYELEIATGWTPKSLAIRRNDGVALELRHDGQGGWSNRDNSLGHLSGCLDVDFDMTPFTNTLPIRRAALDVGESRRFRMVYVPADTLEPFVDEQIYTRLESHRYRYDAADGSFSAEITVDEDGLVRDYPGLFERL